MLCEQAHYHYRGASFPQSTFQVAFFILHPADVSKLPDKNLDSLSDLQEQIHYAQCLDDEKKKQHCCHLRAPTCYVFWG
jgi:hypothetical protein